MDFFLFCWSWIGFRSGIGFGVFPFFFGFIDVVWITVFILNEDRNDGFERMLMISKDSLMALNGHVCSSFSLRLCVLLSSVSECLWTTLPMDHHDQLQSLFSSESSTCFSSVFVNSSITTTRSDPLNPLLPASFVRTISHPHLVRLVVLDLFAPTISPCICPFFVNYNIDPPTRLVYCTSIMIPIKAAMRTTTKRTALITSTQMKPVQVTMMTDPI